MNFTRVVHREPEVSRLMRGHIQRAAPGASKASCKTSVFLYSAWLSSECYTGLVHIAAAGLLIEPTARVYQITHWRLRASTTGELP